MPWFRLEDGFHSHPKVIRAGNEAIGLYVRCGTYAAQHLTDGFIPEHVALLYGTPELAGALVRTKLWRRTRGGWLMPDYLDYNPSAEQVGREREARAERQARWRDKKRGGRDHSETQTKVSPNSQPTPVDNEETGEVIHRSAGQNGRSRRVTGRVANASEDTAPSPTRPAPKEAGAGTAPEASGRAGRNGAPGRANPPGSPVRAVPEWCGECDERTRQIDPDRPRRCPTCHPLRTEAS